MKAKNNELTKLWTTTEILQTIPTIAGIEVICTGITTFGARKRKRGNEIRSLISVRKRRNKIRSLNYLSMKKYTFTRVISKRLKVKWGSDF